MRFRLSITVAVSVTLSLSCLPLEAGGISAQTSTPYATTVGPGTSPSASVPTGLTGLPNIGDDNANPGHRYLNLSWNASTGASGYIIERQTISTGVWTQLTTTSATTYEDSTFWPGAFRYRVSATVANAPNSAPSSVIPQPISYALIDLGLGGAVKITNSGKVLMTNYGSGGYSLWADGTATPFSPHIPGDYYNITDMTEDGTAIGTEWVTASSYEQREAIWSSPSTSTLTAGAVPLQFPPTPDSPASYGQPFNGGITINAAHLDYHFQSQTDGASDGYKHTTPLGTITQIFTPVSPSASPWYTVTTPGNTLTPIRVNNEGDLYYSSSDYTSSTPTPANGIYFNTTLFLSTDPQLRMFSNECAAAHEVYFLGFQDADLVVWSNTGLITTHLYGGQANLVEDDDLAAWPASINAASTIINGTAVASPQVVYGTDLIQCMNPITQEFDPPQPLFSVNPPGWDTIGSNGPHSNNDNGAVTVQARKISDNTYHAAMLIPTELAVDADRNGTIVMQSDVYNSANVDADGNPLPVDSTSSAKPYRFWVNNDQDSTGNDTVPVATPDWQSDSIVSARDLEDWTRLWIDTKGLNTAIKAGTIKVGLKWKNVTSGTTPGIKIADAKDSDGGLEYLANSTRATAQVITVEASDTWFTTNIIPSGNAADFIFQASTWNNLSDTAPITHFLFEGTSKGKGQLVVVFLKSDNTEIGEGPGVWLDLHDIKEMYQRAIASPDPTIPAGTSTPAAPNITEAPDTTGGTFVPDPDESSIHTYVVLVHGFNQSYGGSINFAETMFKRLWWRGYKGRFAAFRWPTYGDGSWSGPVGTYNDSEYVAWHSGTALKTFVASLPRDYAVDIAAHSMGNLVVGEALKEGMTVRHYAMLHAATTAGCYSNGSYTFPTTDTSGIAAPDFDPDTATSGLSYSYWLGGIGSNPINFYDTQDNVVGFDWDSNNLGFKPQAYLTGTYGYHGLNASGQKLFYESLVATRYVTDQGEVKAYIDHSLTGAIGHITTTANGSISSSINDNAFGNEHSSEWVRNIQDSSLQTFYQTLTGAGAFNLQLNP